MFCWCVQWCGNSCTPSIIRLAATQLAEIQCRCSNKSCSAWSGLSDGAIFVKKYWCEQKLWPKRYRSMNSPITNRIAAPLNYNGLPRRIYWRFSVVAVIEIVALNLGFPMVQFLARNIDVSKSYGQNATDQLTHQHNWHNNQPDIDEGLWWELKAEAGSSGMAGRRERYWRGEK